MMSDVSPVPSTSLWLHNNDVPASPPNDGVGEDTHRYRIITELMSELAYSFRVEPEGALVLEWMNEAITRTMGYTVEDINALGWQSFLYDDDVFVVLEHWQRLVAGEADIAEFRVYGENRKVVWVRNYARPVREEKEQRVIRIYGAAQDITARKEAEQHVVALNTQLRLAMKESFHRIKNNLQLVATLIDTQALDYHGALPPDRVEQLSRQIRTLADVHNLLTQSVREDGQAAFVSTRVLVENLCAFLQQMAGERSLECRITEVTLPHRQGTALALIINELIQNALRHGEGTVSIRLETDEEQACLQVEDAGSGFPADFDPCQDAQTGLQLIQDLTESDLNGRMHYANRMEGGASVRVKFPIPHNEL
jgi:PAS domain S-box-containing protein